MAKANNFKPIMYIYDLPYKPLIQLSHILDIDDQWKNLGGIHMKFDFTSLQLMERAFQRGKSPTLELFEKWGDRNGTVKSLFLMLVEMRNQRALLVLKPFVDEKYHKYIQHNADDTLTLSNLTRSSFIDSKSTIASKKSLYSQSESSFKHRNPGADTASGISKYQNDMNMNHNFSTPSLASKMKEISVIDNHCGNGKAGDTRPPDLPDRKKDSCANCGAESMTDNCVQEKIKNVRKQSLPNNVGLNGRPSHLPYVSNISSFEETLPDVMQILYKDICKATDNFNKSRILGKGGFGTVYKGEWKGTSVAIKRLTPRQGHDSASQQLVSLRQSFNEFRILNRCRFDHILSLYGVSVDGTDPCLVYQLMVNGSLEDWLVCRKNTPPLTWSQRSRIAEGTTKGINFLHTAPGRPLIHGDIKSANILLDNNMDAKIGDFGLTREGPGYDNTHVKVTKLHGTECYLPDEYLRHRHLSPQVDIYSYGIVLLEMATGLRPYDQKRGESKLLVHYVSDCSTSGRLESLRDVKAGEENMRWFRELLEIGQKCCSKEKKKRPPMQEVLDQFDKIEKEMSTFEKIRRLSNDKGTVSIGAKMLEDTELRKLSPIQLQKVYDMLNNEQGLSKANEHFEDSHPQNKGRNTVDPSGSKDVNTYAENNNNLNEIRDQSSSNVAFHSSQFSRLNNIPDPPSATVPNPNPDPNSIPKENSSPVYTPPMPLITILQMQISEFNDTNNSIKDEDAVSNGSSDLITDN